MKNNKIRVKSLITHEMYEFICFSEDLTDYFIYRIQPLENSFDIGYISLYEPINMSWDEVREKINEKS